MLGRHNSTQLLEQHGTRPEWRLSGPVRNRIHRLRRTEPEVRYDWTRTWHPPQSHLLRFGT